MALLFMDSFDHYVTADLLEKWSAVETTGQSTVGVVAINAGAGRRSSSGLRATGGVGTGNEQAGRVKRAVSATGATFVLGFACRAAQPSTGLAIGAAYDGATAQLTLVLGTDMALLVRRGDINTGTQIAASAPAVVPASTFVHIEFRGTIDPAAGVVEVRVNGTPVINASGLNTRNSANSTWNVASIGATNYVNFSAALSADFDDLYVLDGSGPAPLNTFLGDCRVDPRVPTGAGATTGWTPSTAPNWSCVDDAAPNDDTDYVSTTAPATDTYALQDAPVAGGTIYGVQLLWNSKKLDAGACSVAPVVRHGTTDYAGTAQNPGTTYAYGRQVYPTNPGTSAAWTESDFNAAEFGLQRTA